MNKVFSYYLRSKRRTEPELEQQWAGSLVREGILEWVDIRQVVEVDSPILQLPVDNFLVVLGIHLVPDNHCPEIAKASLPKLIAGILFGNQSCFHYPFEKY
jgi:hypothetical protein